MKNRGKRAARPEIFQFCVAKSEAIHRSSRKFQNLGGAAREARVAGLGGCEQPAAIASRAAHFICLWHFPDRFHNNIAVIASPRSGETESHIVIRRVMGKGSLP